MMFWVRVECYRLARERSMERKKSEKSQEGNMASGMTELSS